MTVDGNKKLLKMFRTEKVNVIIINSCITCFASAGKHEKVAEFSVPLSFTESF